MVKSKSIVKQAGILAIAGILVRIIGLLYRSPLTHMIGDEGNGYYSTAYNIYALILLISSYSIPTAISKLISEKIALEQYKTAQKIFKCALIYIIIVGGVASIVTFLIAPYIVTTGAVFALRILTPTIFVSGLVGVLRGYFQAHSTTIYTSISQILEQIFNAFVSVGAAYLFIKAIANANNKASIGAGGSALGTGAGVLIALIYLLIMFLIKRKENNANITINENEKVLSTKDIFKSILTIVTPIIIATCVYNLVTVIDMTIFYGIMELRGLDKITIVSTYGVYAGKYAVLMNVPVALASAMSTATIPAISGSYALNDLKDVRKNIENSIAVSMLIIIPCAVGLFTLSYPIMGTLFPQKDTLLLASTTLKIGASATIFYGLSTLSNGILQAIGAVKVPLKNALIALICHIIILIVMLFLMPQKYLTYSLYILAIGTTLYALQMCITNQRSLAKLVNFKYRYKRLFILPLFASIIMGLCTYGIYTLLFIITKRVFLPLVISIICAVFIYFVIILYLYKDHPETIYNIPYMDKIARRVYKK